MGKVSQDDNEPVKGQIIISLLSRDGPSGGTPLAIVGPQGELRGPSDREISHMESEGLPFGWEEKRTENGRPYYVNHITRSTQWIKPQVTNKNRNQSNRNARVSGNNNSNTTDNNCNENIQQDEIINNNTEETVPVSSPSSSASSVTPVISPQKELILRPAPGIPQSESHQRNNFIGMSPTSTTVVPAPNNISCNVPNVVSLICNTQNTMNSSQAAPGSQNILSTQNNFSSQNNSQNNFSTQNAAFPSQNIFSSQNIFPFQNNSHNALASQNITSAQNVPPSAQNIHGSQRQHARRQRSNEERRTEGSSRRRSARNRNSLNAGQMQAVQNGVSTQGPSLSSRLDLPSGYGKFMQMELEQI